MVDHSEVISGLIDDYHGFDDEIKEISADLRKERGKVRRAISALGGLPDLADSVAARKEAAVKAKAKAAKKSK